MELIVMLTYNDQTVKNAIEVFDSAKDLDVTCWGFKNIGLPLPEMKVLVRNMKEAGKTTFLECVSYDEEHCMEAAKIAVECGFDCFMGTLYHPSVGEYVKGKIKYYPFCGNVWANPSILGDDIDGIINDCKRLQALGADGIDLLAYRFVGDPVELIRQFTKEVKLPTCIAGSIDSFARLDFMEEISPASFTMGSALFDKKFVADGTFRENLKAVADYLKK